MSSDNEVRYLSSHEWGRIDEEGILTVGISDHAQDLLGDIVFVELPEVGDMLEAEGESAIVYSPLTGEVIEINEKLLEEPEIINNSPLEDGWFFKIKIDDDLQFTDLLTEEEYNDTCED